MKRIFAEPGVKFSISIVGLFFTAVILRELQQIFIPLILAYFLYYAFEPMNVYLRKKRFPAWSTMIIDLFLMSMVFYLAIRFFYSSFLNFSSQIIVFEDKLNSLIMETAAGFGLNEPPFSNFSISDLLSEMDFGGIASGFFTSTLSFISALFFVVLFFIFVNSGHEKFLSVIKSKLLARRIEQSSKKKKDQDATTDESYSAQDQNKLKAERENMIESAIKDISSQIQRYIIMKFFISLLTGMVTGFTLWLFNVEFFIVWGVMAFILNFIPNIGSVIAVLLPTLMAVVQFESFGFALVVGAILLIEQNLIGNILEPKILGAKLGLNPLMVLLSLLIWGYLWGIVGMFLSVPLTAILKIIFDNNDSKDLRFIGKLMEN
ncbi:MAG: AI-2E family transporter [Ignavibacteriales bacterium]|nr:AI-2E family transporter [Ignavibacteriales bacterium]MCF8305539.1 AI-2E family transporter [Ignavibacteriales bacterium]MCF8315261.1 AI-2E family transporter [Ignavibacteriales bacterium]MCF8436847.1 AI-2E family transporter [Ignavibacteriales bacterium]